MERALDMPFTDTYDTTYVSQSILCNKIKSSNEICANYNMFMNRVLQQTYSMFFYSIHGEIKTTGVMFRYLRLFTIS